MILISNLTCKLVVTSTLQQPADLPMLAVLHSDQKRAAVAVAH